MLGYIIGCGTLETDPEKIEAIKNYPKPTTVKELRSFLGITNFCREFITSYAKIVAPLDRFLIGETKKSVRKLIWKPDQELAFTKIKEAITKQTKRALPDSKKKFILITDASNTAIGAILAQEDTKGKRKMISTFSKRLDKAQTNYSVTDKELLAIVKACEHYRYYLLGKEFELETDHRALAYLKTCNNPTSRMLRWALKLQEYPYRIKYIKGENNPADGLSRSINTLKYNKQTINIEDVAERHEILRKYHLCSGHGSQSNMKFLLLNKYSRKGITRDIENFVQTCKICLESGTLLCNTKNRIIETNMPNDLWECDLIGRIPTKDGMNLFIFIAIDHYTKWIETVILRDKSAESIIKAVEKTIIMKHGIPKKYLAIMD